MNSFPSSVEQYLLEAGFSATEVLLLKKLLTEDALTLRELAAKTGKSTGVLDQAMKKLERKHIVKREWINGNFKFALGDLQAVSRWTKEDMTAKHEMLERKHENFETFIRSVKVDKSRPDMQHFEGYEGIKHAYVKLLECGEEIVQFFPVMVSEQDDPLRDFRVQYFRERRRRGIFSRVIAHDTPLGRRYQSRDPFEYRKTLLAAEDEFPFSFEKIIVGDTVACFNHAEKKACLLHYPDMAKTERESFEMLWKHLSGVKPVAGNGEGAPAVSPGPSFSTRTLSGLREFFLSRRSLAVFALFALVSAGITFGLYKSSQSINFKRMQDKAIAVATTGALQIDTRDLDQLRQKEDYRKPEWEKVNNVLKNIQTNNTDILYMYIFRKSQTDPSQLEFVADPLSMDPFANVDADPTNDVDMNGDGEIEGSPEGGDYLAWPGQTYPTPPPEAFDGFTGQIASTFYEDQWGRVVTGYAPLKDSNGNVVAVLAVDIHATKLDDLTSENFSPVLYFLGFFLLFIVVRMSAFNRSLFQEVWSVLHLRRFFFSIGICAVAAVVVTYGLYQYTAYLNTERVREKVLSVAATGALQFDAADLHELQTEADIAKPQYAKVIATLNEIRTQNPGVKYIYIMRPTEDLEYLAFVADADSFDIHAKIDLNSDGVVDDADHLSPPGERYYIGDAMEFREALETPIAGNQPHTDQWGTLFTAMAPIRDDHGVTIAVLGVDKFASDVQGLTRESFTPLLYFLGFFVLFIFIRIAVFNRQLSKELWRALQMRKVLVGLGVCSLLALMITYGLYWYTAVVNLQRTREKIQSIAATGAFQFDPQDVMALQVEEDWKKPEWARVVNQMKGIRENNSNIFFVYMFRISKNDPTKIEFVADSHSIYPYANTDEDPTNNVDVNKNGTIDSVDVLQWPGQAYPDPPTEVFDAFEGPTATHDVYEDSWGKYISGYAPIKDASGATISVLAVDIQASDLRELTMRTFSPLLYFFLISLIFILIRIAAFYHPFFRKAGHMLQL